MVGGGIGVGLNSNIKSSYKWLCCHYRPGDRIFVVGFSRGAYTVRSLAGMIASQGLLDLTDDALASELAWSRVETVFSNYRKREASIGTTDLQFNNAQAGESGAGRVPIHFVGVWDTVGALGIPDHLGLLNVLDDPGDHAFHDTTLSPLVAHARHVVAIDAMRASFAPTLWTDYSSDADVVQKWFTGVHSDVGGGYVERELSDITLDWMVREAEGCGLLFRGGSIAQIGKHDPQGVLHDSLTGVFNALETRPKCVPRVTDDTGTSAIHQSASIRQENPPLAQPDYWITRTLEVGDTAEYDVYAAQKWNATGLFVSAGERYELSASGQWLDSSISCGPTGTADGHFQLGEVAHVVATGLGVVENLFKRITGNQAADFWMTRRYEDMDWFSLVGVIADGKSVMEGGLVKPHSHYSIGEGMTLSPEDDGYLYCFSNDAWQAYGNNKGSVRLERVIF